MELGGHLIPSLSLIKILLDFMTWVSSNHPIPCLYVIAIFKLYLVLWLLRYAIECPIFNLFFHGVFMGITIWKSSTRLWITKGSLSDARWESSGHMILTFFIYFILFYFISKDNWLAFNSKLRINFLWSTFLKFYLKFTFPINYFYCFLGFNCFLLVLFKWFNNNNNNGRFWSLLLRKFRIFEF
jgi:hypothetical protein